MPAQKPEDCNLLLIEALNRGDLEAAVALFEPNATFVLDSGQVVTGVAAIREVMQSFLALKPTMTMEVNAVHNEDGTLALTRGKWSLSGTGPDGKPVTMSHNSTEVVRRQPDGSWKFIIDNPRGAD